MRKAIFKAYGDLDEIQTITTEKPTLAKNEVLVKVVAAGLNPKDVLVRKGKFKRFSGKQFPQGIGFELAGYIEDAHQSNLKKGDRVFGMVNGWKGRCCAAYVNIAVDELATAPRESSLQALAGVPLAAQTALQAIRDIGKLQPNQNICINGASGGVGTLAIQIAKILGGKVTTVCSQKNTLLCQSLGADTTIAYDEQNILEWSSKFDLFFDVFGNYNYQDIAHLLTPKGIYVTTVPKPAIFKEQFFNFFRKKQAKIVVVKSKSKDLQWLAEHIATNQIKPIVDKVYPLEDVAAAQDYIASKRATGKVIIEVGEE